MTDKNTRPVVLVDALNVFTRHYAANPTISTLGEHMGGTVGFLYAIKHFVDRMSPRQINVVWEGGGSARRRALFPEYKSQRRPVRMNRWYGDDIPDTVENRDAQVKAIVKLLKHVPVCQVYVGDCEADDVIAYMCRKQYRNDEVVIASSDKDYYQLLDDTTRVYRPGKKIFVTKDDVVRDFGISPVNFSLAKALCGDGSDNIPGIKGVGFKTLAKRFPALARDEEFGIDFMMTECKNLKQSSKAKVFPAILESEKLIKRNMRLIDLDGSMLAPAQTSKVDYTLDTFEPARDKMGLIRELVGLGLNEFNADAFFYTMTML